MSVELYAIIERRVVLLIDQRAGEPSYCSSVADSGQGPGEKYPGDEVAMSLAIALSGCVNAA